MSKQRYLLVFILVIVTALQAQISFQNDLELGFSENSGSPELILEDRFDMTYQSRSGLRIDIDNDLLRRDFKVENLSLTRYNSLHARASYMLRNTSLRAGLRNTLYGDADKLALFPITQPMMAYDKQMQNIAYLGVEQGLGSVRIGLDTYAKILNLRPWEYTLDPNTFEMIAIEQEDDSLTDFVSKLNLDYELVDNTTVYAQYTRYQSDLDEASSSLLGQSEIGVNYENTLFDRVQLRGSFDWQNRQGDINFGERSNLYNTRLRMHFSLNPGLNFSLAYSNHLCSDPQLSELLLISNMVYGTLKYSYAYDYSGASYTVLAAKYSPEHKASAVLADTDFKVLNRLWIGAETLYLPDSYASYRLKSTYRLGVYNSLQLVYEYRDNISVDTNSQKISMAYHMLY